MSGREKMSQGAQSQKEAVGGADPRCQPQHGAAPSAGPAAAAPARPRGIVAKASAAWGWLSPRHLCRLGDLAMGAVAALGFPLVVSALAPTPLFDAAPRELLVLLAPFGLARITAAPISTRAACMRAWTVGLGFFALLLHWLFITMTRFGELPPLLSGLFLALLIAFCAAFFAAVPWAARRLIRRGWPLPWAMAAAVVVFEWLRGDGAGFPWGAWGYAAARHLPLAHLAQLGGVPLISAWLTAAGGLLAGLLAAATDARAASAAAATEAGAAAASEAAAHHPLFASSGPAGSASSEQAAWPADKLARRRQLLAVGVALVALWGVGLTVCRRPVTCAPGPKVGLVQGNIDQSIKNHPAGHAADIVAVHRELSLAAVAAGAELLIWPESSVPDVVDTGRPWPAAWRLPVPTIFGVVARNRVGHYFNAAVWAEPDGSIHGRYDKHHLVPFGEYVPLRGILPIDRLVPGLIDITPGQADVTLGPRGEWGPLICYDGVFAQYSRRQAAAGATVLTNLTNDAWYAITGAPYQHRDFYILRAIETGRWVARATNTGISLFIDPHGRQHRATRLGERTFTLGEVQHCSGTTLYRQVGDWVGIGAVLSLMASLLPRRRRQLP